MKEFTAARAGRPLVVVVAGPNGAGKRTTAPSLLQDALAVSEFVNADAIAAGLSAFRPESMAIAAGRLMLGRIRALGMARVDFAFETTLASKTFAPRNGFVLVVTMVFDNSTLAAPRLIAARMPGEETRLIDADAWRNLLELSR